MIDKGVYDKGCAWNLSNCECECNKSCDIGGYLDYENCRFRKRLVDKLVEEYNEIFEEVKIVDKNEDKCSSCIFYIVLFSIFFTIDITIATYFVYYIYMTRNKENVSKNGYIFETKKLLIIWNGSSKTNRY